MFHQFERAGCIFWKTSQFKMLTAAFPLLLEFPHIIDYPETYKSFREFTTTHELAHMIQFYVNDEEDRLLLDNFGWRQEDILRVKGTAVVNRELEVFAIQILLDEISTFDSGMPLRGMAMMLRDALGGGATTQYWVDAINATVEEFRPSIMQIANETFRFIVDNKDYFIQSSVDATT